MTTRSRDAAEHPSYGTLLLSIVTTGLDPVVHAAAPLTNAGGSAAKATLLHGLPGHARQWRKRKNERKSEAKRRQTQR